ncbi:MAG: type II/IV secretion system protein [Verrucomicrobia bacterium]|nr:type II/IV secretion system protein [Verrucomicrobiota bacterium]
MANPAQRTTQYLQAVSGGSGITVGELVDHILYDAIKAGASDIHIEPWENVLMVRIRLSGVLTELIKLPLDLMEKIAGRFKAMANLVTYQSNLPQEGRAPAGEELGGVELRISTFPTTRGEKIVARVFDPRNRKFNLADLGFDEKTLASFTNLLSRPSGLLLVTGPTGSGKTTVLYAALNYIGQRAGATMSIATVEDPVEFNLSMISQSQANPAQEFTYAIALRSLMRQDPQVIMIGEIRDSETAAIAVQAGLTGHLVLSTTHSGIAAGGFTRLINMDIEPYLLASSVIGVLGTRLVRKNCPHCSLPYLPDATMLKLLPEEAVASADFQKGRGCGECLGTGYVGRTSLTELLVADEVFREAVLQKLPTRELQKVAIQQGMQTMWQNGVNQVLSGHTTLEEIVRVIAVDQL